MIKAPALGGLERIAHGFFTRRGGSSSGIYATLNCGIGSKDKRARVAENRAHVANALGVAVEHLLTPYQFHSTQVATARAPWPWRDPPRADALVTDVPGLAIGISTADCAPILLADGQAGVIGAAHSGWRGARAGICAAVVGAMEKLGATRGSIRAAVGPCISGPSYEVGPEFHKAFTDDDGGNERYFRADPESGRFRFDLPAYVVDALTACGLETVDLVARCTYLEGDDFFSYRRATHRGEADYGRQLSAIVLSAKKE